MIGEFTKDQGIFDTDITEAKNSGNPFRVECHFSLGKRVIYLTQAEIDEITNQPVPPSPTTTDLENSCISGIATPRPPGFGFDLHRAFIAKAISDEAYRLNKAPGALTNAELIALRQRIANIYKAL